MAYLQSSHMALGWSVCIYLDYSIDTNKVMRIKMGNKAKTAKRKISGVILFCIRPLYSFYNKRHNAANKLCPHWSLHAFPSQKKAQQSFLFVSVSQV